MAGDEKTATDANSHTRVIFRNEEAELTGVVVRIAVKTAAALNNAVVWCVVRTLFHICPMGQKTIFRRSKKQIQKFPPRTAGINTNPSSHLIQVQPFR